MKEFSRRQFLTKVVRGVVAPVVLGAAVLACSKLETSAPASKSKSTTTENAPGLQPTSVDAVDVQGPAIMLLTPVDSDVQAKEIWDKLLIENPDYSTIPGTDTTPQSVKVLNQVFMIEPDDSSNGSSVLISSIDENGNPTDEKIHLNDKPFSGSNDQNIGGVTPATLLSAVNNQNLSGMNPLVIFEVKRGVVGNKIVNLQIPKDTIDRDKMRAGLLELSSGEFVCAKYV